jgi:mannitol/fructose-specific phosphotransferase system IIA component (Ntr-type)
MNLFDYLKEECIEIADNISSRDEILQKIASLAKRSDALKEISEEEIFEALKKREDIGSTGFEDGIAIPHCRFDKVNTFVVGILVVPNGIDFAALDGKKSDLFFFIIGPEADRDEHVRLLSGISRTMAIKGVKKEISAKTSPVDLREAFLRHVSDRFDPKSKDEKCFFHISVQMEEKFISILEMVSATCTSISVIEANDAGRYLYSLPLFSTFWNSEEKGFHRIICGVVDKKLANELIRGIHVITDGLEDEKGVMLTISEASYCSGSLKA